MFVNDCPHFTIPQLSVPTKEGSKKKVPCNSIYKQGSILPSLCKGCRPNQKTGTQRTHFKSLFQVIPDLPHVSFINLTVPAHQVCCLQRKTMSTPCFSVATTGDRTMKGMVIPIECPHPDRWKQIRIFDAGLKWVGNLNGITFCAYL